MVLLQRTHYAELSTTLEDLAPALLGSAFHAEITAGESKRLSITTSTGKEVSGEYDVVVFADKDKVCIKDIKVCKCGAIVLGEKAEWAAQLNLYAELLEETQPHLTVVGLDNECLLTDWNRRGLTQGMDWIKPEEYPLKPIAVVPQPLWPAAERKEYLAARIDAHEKAELVDLENVPLCTREERWAKGGGAKIAHIESGRRLSGTEVFGNTVLAEHAWQKLPPERKAKTKVLAIPEAFTRCLYYCSARSFCRFGRSLTVEE